MSTLKISFFRHGDSLYIEHAGGKKTRDISDLGEAQITRAAVAHLAATEDETILFWSSNAWRAQDSENVFMTIRSQAGAKFVKRKGCRTLRPIARLKPEDKNWEMATVHERVRRLFRWIVYFLKRNRPTNLHILSVTHYEFLHPIADHLFGKEFFRGQGFQKAEAIICVFRLDESTGLISLEVEYRNAKTPRLFFSSQSSGLIPFD